MSKNVKMDLVKNKLLAESIGKEISSQDSPVGIDAKQTHIIIIEKLIDIQDRLEKLESRLIRE